MRTKLAAILGSLIALFGIMLVGSPAQASVKPADNYVLVGTFTHHLSCSVYDTPSKNTYTFGMDYTYTVTGSLSSDYYTFKSASPGEVWNTSPAFGANEVYLSLGDSPSHFVEIPSTRIGGSSSTLNDVAGHGTQYQSNTSLSFLAYNNPYAGYPTIHMVVWGVGPGNSTATCGAYLTLDNSSD